MNTTTFLTNTFTKGMNCDTDVTMLGNDLYIYAENVRVITNDLGTTGVLLNIEGVKKYKGLDIPDNELILGTTVINKLAVVVTRALNNGFYDYNKVYRISGFDTDTPVSTVICKGDLGVCEDKEDTNISIVGNYETDSNIKVYFTDGKTSVKILNIVDGKYEGTGPNNPLLDSDGNILNPLALDITPGSIMPPFRINDLGYGNLASGVIQYCYQLFNVHAAETTVSTLSELIHLTDSVSSSDSMYYKGLAPNKNSGKSCELSAPLLSHDFQKCRIISISYTANNSQPRIFIVDEIDLLPSQTSIEYKDTGNNIIGELTVALFNALTGFQFVGATIEKMLNRLFVANVTEDSWNPFYDARAYRSNSTGLVVLNSANSSEVITQQLPNTQEARNAFYKSIPETHDCINPFNSMVSGDANSTNQFEYSTITNTLGIKVKGGSGLNIDYSFVMAGTYTQSGSVVQSELNGLVLDRTNIFNVGMNVAPFSTRGVLLFSSEDSSIKTYVPFSSSRSIIRNYADPIIAANYRSFLRDEVYRFGIVLYNKKNVPSPVKWIGDVRMPHASDSNYIPFYPTREALLARPLGIRFNVRNLPEDCIAYEIVRCDRTESDRSILMLGAMSATLNSSHGDESGGLGGSTDTRPYLWHTYTDKIFSSVAYNKIYTSEMVGSEVIWKEKLEQRHCDFIPSLVKNDYVTFTSPEVSISGLSIEKLFKNTTYFESLYGLASAFGATKDGVTDSTTLHPRIMKNAKKVKNIDGGEDSAKYEFGTVIYLADDDSYRVYMSYDSFVASDGYYSVIDSLISKNYIPFSVVNTNSAIANIAKKTSNILNIKIAKTIPYNALNDKAPYYTAIGDINYLNLSLTIFADGFDAQYVDHKIGCFGPCLIVQSNNVRSNITPINATKSTYGSIGEIDVAGASTYALNAVVAANIKRSVNPYGGNTFSSRLNSIYIPIGAYNSITQQTSYVFGGDTYLNLLDLAATTIFQLKDPNDWNKNKMFCAAYIPFESSINLALLYGDSVHRSWRASDEYLDIYAQLEPVLMGSYHVQDAPYFAYNDVYSTQPGSKKFIPASLYAENSVKSSNRIVCSEAKTGNEVLDNWTKFKFANYLDVDNQYGSITNLLAFKDRLYFWQDSALGIASVNERSLISDNNIGALTLGTGGILSRADYLTTTNGSSIINDRSIVNSDSTIYWYDFDKNEICNYSNSIDLLSKTKGVLSYLNELYSEKRNITLALYDKKYNEVWFKFYDKSLVFNELIGLFTCFYTFNPLWALLFSDKVVSIKDNKYYIINTLDIDNLDTVDKVSKIRFAVNKDAAYTKTFDNVFFSGEFSDPSTVDELTAVQNIIGTAGNITYNTKNLFAYPYMSEDKAAIDYREYTYRFAIGREESGKTTTYNSIIDSYSGRMKGKYLICDYTFNCDNNKTFKLPYINTTYRYSLV